MLCWSDDRTQFMLDMSLHGEKGKVGGKEQGLTARQRQKRYSRERDELSHAAKRKKEYFKSKGLKLIEMGNTKNTTKEWGELAAKTIFAKLVSFERYLSKANL